MITRLLQWLFGNSLDHGSVYGDGCREAAESFFGDYPICNLSVENRIKWTAQWNTAGGTLYSDNLEYWL